MSMIQTQPCVITNTEIKKGEHLFNIIENELIYSVFQPLIELKTGDVFGYEALSRLNKYDIIKNPEDLFLTAQKFGATARLEKICRKKALISANELQIPGYLTINICPSVIKSTNYEKGTTLALISELTNIKNTIILELTERCYIENYCLFKKAVDYYRNQGFRIAIDDLGSGFSDLKMLLQIEPYMVKIDGFLVSDIHKSIKKRRLLKSLVTFCHEINTIVVAECVEKKEELKVLIDLKVDLAQGYYLGKPDKNISCCSKKAYETILDINERNKSINNKNPYSIIGSLSLFVEPVQENEMVSKVSECFNNNETLTTIPILNGKVPVGIVNKRELFYRLGQRFGYDLFYLKNIKTLVEPALVFDFNTPLEDVSQRVLNRSERTIYDAVIIVKNGLYYGIVKVHHILERITEQKIKLAQQANPLTGLPGNYLIKENIESRIISNQVFAVLYFDLDNFKPFNDNFGFEQGDFVLQFLGSLLKKIITEWDLKSFIGHVGGDDFIAICRAQGIEELCKVIIEKFDSGIIQFHDIETCKKGYYESKDRQGNIKKFNILSLSIAVISTRDRIYNSYGHIASVASEVKKQAKKIRGSSYYKDQRRN